MEILINWKKLDQFYIRVHSDNYIARKHYHVLENRWWNVGKVKKS